MQEGEGPTSGEEGDALGGCVDMRHVHAITLSPSLSLPLSEPKSDST